MRFTILLFIYFSNKMFRSLRIFPLGTFYSYLVPQHYFSNVQHLEVLNVFPGISTLVPDYLMSANETFIMWLSFKYTTPKDVPMKTTLLQKHSHIIKLWLNNSQVFFALFFFYHLALNPRKLCQDFFLLRLKRILSDLSQSMCLGFHWELRRLLLGVRVSGDMLWVTGRKDT